MTLLKWIVLIAAVWIMPATHGNARENVGRQPGSEQAGDRPAPVSRKHVPLNVRDFGAKGDGVTDDTDAIQRCLLQAVSADYPFVGYRGYVTAPEVFFPKGTYVISRTLLVRSCGGRGDNGYNLLYLRGEQATIKQTNPAEDILYFRLSYRNMVEGLTFEGGKRQIKLWSDNLNESHIIIRDCVFCNSASYAIDDQLRTKDPTATNRSATLEPYLVGKDDRGLPVLTPVDETQSPIFGYVSTCMRISRCSFQRCRHVVSAWADWTLMDDCTIETHPDMSGPAILSGGALMMENVQGLGRATPGKEQWWISVDPGKQPSGVVGLDLKNVTLKTDSKQGWCVIRNEAKFTGGNHVYLIADGCKFQSAGARENSLIYLVEAPNLINIRNCREMKGRDVNILGFAKPFEEDYFHEKDREVFSFMIAENNRNLIPNLPAAMAPFVDPPLPEKIARQFEIKPTTVTLPSMRKDIGKQVNLLDFGAKCDGTADDTEAFRKAFAAVGRESCLVEVVVPNGLYRLGQTIELPRRVVVRGSGYAGFTAPPGKKGPVFAAPDAEHLVLQNLHFFQCEQAVAITTKPGERSDILINNCYFSLNSNCDVTCLSGTGAAGEPNKTTLRMSDCTCSHSRRVLLHNARYALLENNWITTDASTTNSGAIVNRGTLHLKCLLGVPQPIATNDARWVDNYDRVFCDRCRFGGEGGGLPMVVNFAAKGEVLLQNSWLCIHGGNPKRPTIVDCVEIPELIALRGNWSWPWPQMMVTVRKGAHGDLKGRWFESGNTAPPSVRDARDAEKESGKTAPWTGSSATNAETLGSDGEMRIDLGSGVAFDMIRVAPGTFTIGSPAGEQGRRDNENQHAIRITKPFYLGKYEVTQAVWERVMTAKITNQLAKTNSVGYYWPHSAVVDITLDPRPSRFGGWERPVERVSWRQIKEFIARLNLLVEGGGFRLPTEAEWEYAARAGTNTAYFFGNKTAALDTNGWYQANSGGETHRVGTARPNPWGFRDMVGNVWELCEDEFTGPYAFRGAETLDDYCARGNELGNAYQTIRGGSFAFSARLCRPASRSGFDAWHWSDDIGFRLARSME